MSGPEAWAVGSKVTVRLHDPAGGYRDLLGILETPTSVRKKDGSLQSFDPNSVAIWKVIPPHPLRAGKGAPVSIRIAELDEVAEKTWPATEIFDFGGWRFRMSNGFTRRANSVRPLASPPYGMTHGEIDQRIDDVVERFRSRRLIPTFSLSLPIYSSLDEYLGERGWSKEVHSHVMVADRSELPTFSSSPFSYSSEGAPSSEWLALQGDHNGVEVMSRFPARYGQMTVDGHTVAVGRIAEWNDWAIFTRIYVSPKHRGQGLAKQLLLQLATEVSASRFMLQVESRNSPAISLYQSLNFKMHNDYSYRMLR